MSLPLSLKAIALLSVPENSSSINLMISRSSSRIQHCVWKRESSAGTRRPSAGAHIPQVIICNKQASAKLPAFPSSDCSVNLDSNNQSEHEGCRLYHSDVARLAMTDSESFLVEGRSNGIWPPL